MVAKRFVLCVGMAGLSAMGAYLGGCVGDSPPSDPVKDAGLDTSVVDAANDAGLDASPDVDAAPRCDPNKPFGNLRLLDNINAAGSANEGARLTPDEKTVYFTRFGDAGATPAEVFVATRATPQDPFPVGLPLAGGNTADNDRYPTVTADQLFIYVWNGPKVNTLVASRATTNDPFSAFAVAPTFVVPTATNNEEPFVLPDHSALYFVANATAGTGGFDVYRSARVSGVFQPPAPVPGVNTASDELIPLVTPDELTIYFASDRAGPSTAYDIYVAHRSTTSSAFGTAQIVAPLNAPGKEFPTWVSNDDCVIVFTSDRPFDGGPGVYRVYVADRPK